MELKSLEGHVTLTDDTVILTFDGKLAMADKKNVSPHVIPLKHVREVDFDAPTILTPGHLRIIMRRDQPIEKLAFDTYAVQLGAGRRVKEAREFAAQLKNAVDAVNYETPEPPAPVISDPDKPTFKEALKSFQDIGDALTDAKMSNTTFRGIKLAGRTLSKGWKSWPASDCEVIIDTGANVSARVTATRVATGAMLAGTTGALIGSIAKKDRSMIYMTVITPDSTFLEKVSGLDEAKARDFAMKVKRAGDLQVREKAAKIEADAIADGRQDSGSVPPPPPPAGVAAGWYPRGDVQEYWDGQGWTGHTAPLA